MSCECDMAICTDVNVVLCDTLYIYGHIGALQKRFIMTRMSIPLTKSDIVEHFIVFYCHLISSLYFDIRPF